MLGHSNVLHNTSHSAVGVVSRQHPQEFILGFDWGVTGFQLVTGWLSGCRPLVSFSYCKEFLKTWVKSDWLAGSDWSHPYNCLLTWGRRYFPLSKSLMMTLSLGAFNPQFVERSFFKSIRNNSPSKETFFTNTFWLLLCHLAH